MKTTSFLYPGKVKNGWKIVTVSPPSATCQCVCGATRVIKVFNLVSGRSKSCGCGRVWEDVLDKTDRFLVSVPEGHPLDYAPIHKGDPLNRRALSGYEVREQLSAPEAFDLMEKRLIQRLPLSVYHCEFEGQDQLNQTFADWLMARNYQMLFPDLESSIRAEELG